MPPKKGKGKLPLFCGNGERVNPIYAGGWYFLFFMNSIVSVLVFILVPTPFSSRLNAFAILQAQTIFVVVFLIRSRYPIFPVDGLINALHVCS